MTIVNCTPHTLNIVAADGSICQFPATGIIARVSETRLELPSIEGIAVSAVRYGEVVDLPEPVEGTVYAVSALVRSAVPHRFDVVSPGPLIRDAAGNPVGCQGFTGN